jgi:hypothetical protein
MIFVKPYLLLLNLLLEGASKVLDNSLSNLLMRKRSSNYMRVSGTHFRKENFKVIFLHDLYL